MRWCLGALSLTGLLLVAPAVGAAAPTITDPSLSPTAWSDSPSALAGWTQSGFDPPQPGPALVQTRPTGSASAPWTTRATVAGPLVNGANGIIGMDVASLEGRFEVRVSMPNVPGLAPTVLGTLQLDRTPPEALAVSLAPTAGPARVEWTQRDGGSGTDPEAPIVVEHSADPTGAQAGPWVAFADPPAPGDGRRSAAHPTADLADGRYAVRVRSRDRVGNGGSRPLGTLLVDRTPPRIGAASAVTDPDDPANPVVRVFADIDDGPGAGVAQVRVVNVIAFDQSDLIVSGPGAPGQPYLVDTGGPGRHALRIEARDAVGNLAASEVLPVHVRSERELALERGLVAPDEQPGRRTTPPAGEPGPGVGRAPGAGVRLAWTGARRFHAARAGLTLRGRPRVVRRPAAWRAVLGRDNAALYAGYTTPSGTVLLGPAASAGLEALHRARVARPGARAPSRADLDRMIMGLAVVLHESLHATGPPVPDDYHRSPSARALEEALTEAATADLLRRYVASLALPAALRARLLGAAGRYRPAYPLQVRWLRLMSVRATGGPVRSRAAVSWRIAAADRWGPERWERLAGALGENAVLLRLTAPAILARP